MMAAMAVDAQHDLYNDIGQSLAAVMSGASKFVRPAHIAPGPKQIQEAMRRITHLEKKTAEVARKNARLKVHLYESFFSVQFTEAEVVARIEAVENHELLLHGICGALLNAKKQSVDGDIHLGEWRSKLSFAYSDFIAEVQKAACLATDVVNHLRQFAPPENVFDGQLNLTEEVMDGFIEASDAIMDDVRNGKDIEFS